LDSAGWIPVRVKKTRQTKVGTCVHLAGYFPEELRERQSWTRIGSQAQ
jgi:hypothetical protein